MRTGPADYVRLLDQLNQVIVVFTQAPMDSSKVVSKVRAVSLSAEALQA